MDKKPFDLLTLGEIMLRLSAPGNERLQRGDLFEKRAGGSELNVASGVALLGLRTGVISKLPESEMGTYIKNRIRFVGVSDDYLIYDKSEDARLGIYYYENGAAPRKPSIVYDRKGASINRLSLADLPNEVYASTRCFHT
nr:sugar kinase [Oscillospiraceae bacterium]